MLMGATRRGRGLSRSKPLVVRYASRTIAKGHILSTLKRGTRGKESDSPPGAHSGQTACYREWFGV